MKQKIKHVFFDLDHTLWHFDANALLAYKEVSAIVTEDASVPTMAHLKELKNYL